MSDIVQCVMVQVKDKKTGMLGKPVGLHPDIANHRIAKGEAVAVQSSTPTSKRPSSKEKS